MKQTISLINGPNLNLLGKRELAVYGKTTLQTIATAVVPRASDYDFKVTVFHSNSEGEIIDEIQRAIERSKAIIINAAGYTHTSIAIRDALAAFDGPVIEVHLSNIKEREPFRHNSYISDVADEVIMGKGPEGYLDAVEAVRRLLSS